MTKNNIRKSGFSTFKEKHPKTTKAMVVTGKAMAVTAGIIAVGGTLYTFGYKPKMGKLSFRSHFTKYGKPKIGYKSSARANFQTIKDFVIRKGHAWMPAYVCPFCGDYHIGHKH